LSHSTPIGGKAKIPDIRPRQPSVNKSILATNRGHRAIENSCHYVIDWNFNEDRSRIGTGYGPSNITRLRRFAVGIKKRFLKTKESIAEKCAA